MSNGVDSILVLHPANRANVTFNTGTLPTGTDTYAFTVDLGSLVLNDGERVAWDYEQNALGGIALKEKGELVPITFPVVIKATTSVARRQAYRALLLAVTNRAGGTFEYKPEGASRSTFYHYTASGAPRLYESPTNRWDAGPASDGYYTLVVEVELMTQPIATSDPDNPVAISEMTATLDNWHASPLTNRVLVPATSLAGSLPALVRLTVAPESGQSLGRVIVVRRSTADDADVATRLVTMEAEDATAIYPATGWSEVADASRAGGAYMRCDPTSDGNGIDQALRFPSFADAGFAGEGRFAVFGVAYDDGPAARTWAHQVKLYSGNLSQVGDTYYASGQHSWQLIYAGEFDLPLTEMPDGTDYDEGPYLEWHATRLSGTSEFRLDAIILVWISGKRLDTGTALDVVCGDDAEGGVVASEELYLGNLPESDGSISEKAFVASSAGDLRRILMTAPRGDFVELDPGYDHRIWVHQERHTGIVYTDDFSNYLANRMIVISPIDDPTQVIEDFTGTLTSEEEPANFNEGEAGTKLTLVDSCAHVAILDALDSDYDRNGTVPDSAYVCLAIYIADASDISEISITFASNNVSPSAETSYAWTSFVTGWNYLYVRKDQFVDNESFPGFSWTHVFYTELNFDHEPNAVVIPDYLRIELTDPDGSYPNALGGAWDVAPQNGMWTITEDVEEDSPGATLACLYSSAPAYAELIAAETPNDLRYRARMMAMRDNDLEDWPGWVGLTYRGATTPNAELAQGYLAKIRLAGSIGTIGLSLLTSGEDDNLWNLQSASLGLVTGKWYTLGVVAKGTTHRVYMALASALDYDDEAVFDEQYLKVNVTDATFASGRCGVMCDGALGRFDDVVLESLDDKFIPADQISLSGSAVFRTIVPFD